MVNSCALFLMVVFSVAACASAGQESARVDASSGDLVTNAPIDASPPRDAAAIDAGEPDAGNSSPTEEPLTLAVSANVLDFGRTETHRTVNRSVLIKNTSQRDTVDLQVRVTGSGFSLTNDCTFLAAGATCSANVAMTSISQSTKFGRLYVEHTDVETLEVFLQGLVEN